MYMVGRAGGYALLGSIPLVLVWLIMCRLAPTLLIITREFWGNGMEEWDGGWGLIGVSPYFSAAHRKLLSVVVLASLYQHRNIVRVKTPTQHRSI